MGFLHAINLGLASGFSQVRSKMNYWASVVDRNTG